MDPRIRSLFICHLSMLVISLGSSIVFTSIWPYLNLLDPDVTLEQYSFVVAADAFGNVVASPLCGWAADKLGKLRPVAIVAHAVFIVGNVFYALLSLIPRGGPDSHDPRVWTALVVRFIVGSGTGVGAALRGYISKVTTAEERTTHVALISLFQMLGLILGPAFQAALTPLGEKTISEDSDIVIDMYTMTGWLSVINGTVGLLLFMPGIFQEASGPPPPKPIDDDDKAGVDNEGKDIPEADNDAKSVSSQVEEEVSEKPAAAAKPLPPRTKPRELLKQYSRISVLNAQAFPDPEDSDSEDGDGTPKTYPMPHWFGIVTCVYSFFAYFTSFVLLDTLLSPLALDQWGWAPADMILYTGITMAGGGILAIFCFIAIAPLSKRFDERLLLLLGGVVPMVISRLICLPFGDTHPPMTLNATLDCLGTPDYPLTTPTDNMFSSTSMGPPTYEGISIDPDGCEYCWCTEVPVLGVTQFMIGYAVSMIAFPFCITVIATIFSKMLGRAPQGFWMGILTMAGGLARVVGPIGFSFLYQELGTYYTFGTLAVIQALSGVLILIAYKKLVPAPDA